MPHGICAGQGWESGAQINLAEYHRAKTGALFITATQMGAIAADHDPEPWDDLAARIGEAFQVADDLKDPLGSGETIGKPCGPTPCNCPGSRVRRTIGRTFWAGPSRRSRRAPARRGWRRPCWPMPAA